MSKIRFSQNHKVNHIELERLRSEQLKECHAIVWRYRTELEPHWPTPDTWDCLLFAQTEMGEAIDADLRGKPEYARNRDKDLSVLDELADCALMLFTALGKEHDRFWTDSETIGYGYSDTCPDMWADYTSCLAEALDKAVRYYSGVHAWRRPTMELLNHLAIHPGMDLPTRLTARLRAHQGKKNAPPANQR